MEKLPFFDCNCSFGNRTRIRDGSFSDVNSLLDAMQRYSIEKALVYHSLSRLYHPVLGNDMLMREIADNPSLYPVWTVMPNHTGEFYSAGELAIKMKENKVKAVRLFPSEHGYLVSNWCCGELWQFLQDNHVLVMLEMGSLSADDIVRICSEYQDLKIILMDTGYTADRYLHAILMQFPNIYIQSAGYRVCGGIELLCKKFGARRVIFGSGMPDFSGAAAVAMITYANIDEEDKRKIAYGNLSGLLNEVKI